ncbi:unnamed protein product [Caenorhabditis sp. 36 PRJEB53466]|nr:unnamed protein product [Caenorhabditis sp. 36 PRJEB53466]
MAKAKSQKSKKTPNLTVSKTRAPPKKPTSTTRSKFDNPPALGTRENLRPRGPRGTVLSKASSLAKEVEKMGIANGSHTDADTHVANGTAADSPPPPHATQSGSQPAMKIGIVPGMEFGTKPETQLGMPSRDQLRTESATTLGSHPCPAPLQPQHEVITLDDEPMDTNVKQKIPNDGTQLGNRLGSQLASQSRTHFGMLPGTEFGRPLPGTQLPETQFEDQREIHLRLLQEMQSRFYLRMQPTIPPGTQLGMHLGLQQRTESATALGNHPGPAPFPSVPEVITLDDEPMDSNIKQEIPDDELEDEADRERKLQEVRTILRMSSLHGINQARK